MAGNIATFTDPVGVFGNLVVITLVFVDAAPDLAISISDDTGITLTIGTTGGVTTITWDALAALFNADPDASVLAFMVGVVTNSLPDTSSGSLVGGSAGLGLGQFFFAGPEPPPPTPSTLPPPGGARLPVVLLPNDADFCLHHEYRFYVQIDRERLSCGRMPGCFKVDEREWGSTQ